MPSLIVSLITKNRGITTTTNNTNTNTSATTSITLIANTDTVITKINERVDEGPYL